MTFRPGDDTIEPHAGAFVLVPPNVPHTFCNTGTPPTRFLNIQMTAGLEQYLKKMWRPRTATPPNPSRMMHIAAQYNCVVVDWRRAHPTTAREKNSRQKFFGTIDLTQSGKADE